MRHKEVGRYKGKKIFWLDFNVDTDWYERSDQADLKYINFIGEKFWKVVVQDVWSWGTRIQKIRHHNLFSKQMYIIFELSKLLNSFQPKKIYTLNRNKNNGSWFLDFLQSYLEYRASCVHTATIIR